VTLLLDCVGPGLLIVPGLGLAGVVGAADKNGTSTMAKKANRIIGPYGVLAKRSVSSRLFEARKPRLRKL
jgi:hypothetical protein